MKLLDQAARRFRALPIRQKLRVAFVVTTAIASLLAGVGIVAADSILYYGNLQRDLSSFVRIIGDNSTGALAFDDAGAASETLAALRARSHVETACLYKYDGTRLAAYRRPGHAGDCPLPAGERIVSFKGALIASHRIEREGRMLGHLVVRYDLNEIVDRVQIYGATVLVALAVSSAAALLLSSRLRALITGPILDLVSATRAVASSKDYRIRVEKRFDDEMGSLADALNHMLQAIQSRDSDLQRVLSAQQDAVARLAQLNADLKRSNLELARSNQDLECFAFVASHDLQEPLRMIASYAQLLVAEYSRPGDTRSAEFVGHIVDGANRMRELLADLLSYTELAGASEQPPQAVDLNAVLDKVRHTLGGQIGQTQAELEVDPLPVLRAHEGRLTSLFLNLIGNAMKYRSERPPRIRVSMADGGDYLCFAVADNGIGIAPEYQQRVFTAFKRLHGRDIPGTGIGLAICQRVVEGYGGRIWVESAVGQGSTFRFVLPKSMSEHTSQHEDCT